LDQLADVYESIVPLEIMFANTNGFRKIDLIVMFSVFFLDHYVRGNDRAEVVHCHFCKDFLSNAFFLFGVQMRKRQGVLQFPKGSFDPPAHVV